MHIISLLDQNATIPSPEIAKETSQKKTMLSQSLPKKIMD